MSKDETPLSDQLKKVVDDLDLENKVKDASAAAEQVVLRGLEATGSYLREHRGDIEGFFDRAVGAIDRQTGGRYAEQVEQVRGQLHAGVASLADREWVRADAGPGDRETAELTAPEVAGALDAPDVTAPEERPYPGETGETGATGTTSDTAEADAPGGWSGSTDQV